LQEGVATFDAEVLFRSGAALTPFVERNWQRPEEPVPLLPHVSIAPGEHDYWRYGVNATTDPSAGVTASANLSSGTFFDGRLDKAGLFARLSTNPYVSLRVNYEVNRLRSLGIRDTSLVTHLAGPELRVFLNPRVQWSAFYQYNTVQELGTLNARFSWELAPLSYVYVVFNDRRAVDGGSAPRGQSLIVKVSWLRQL
jgi:hypothetical protein